MKRILRDKANFDVLEGFLSALLNEEIQVIALLESEANQEAELDKQNRVDLLVKGDNDFHFIIEVQYSDESQYLKHLLFGAAKLIVENIQTAREKLNLMKMSEAERRAYEHYWVTRASYQDALQTAVAAAQVTAVTASIKQGKEETAHKMRTKGLELALIAELSGLNEAEIMAL